MCLLFLTCREILPSGGNNCNNAGHLSLWQVLSKSWSILLKLYLLVYIKLIKLLLLCFPWRIGFAVTSWCIVLKLVCFIVLQQGLLMKECWLASSTVCWVKRPDPPEAQELEQLELESKDRPRKQVTFFISALLTNTGCMMSHFLPSRLNSETRVI